MDKIRALNDEAVSAEMSLLQERLAHQESKTTKLNRMLLSGYLLAPPFLAPFSWSS